MAKQKIKSCDVLRVVDIDHTQLSPETLNYLQLNGEVTYRDQVLKEDIYNIEGTLDQFNESNNHEEVVARELEEINSLINKKQAGYFRIIYS